MQWIVDIVKLKLAAYLKGKIFLWSGAIVNIPDGWALCDGTQGTPDLLSKFIPGAGSTYSPEDTGGVPTHRHDFIASGFFHKLPLGTGLVGEGNDPNKTDPHSLPGLTGSFPNRPPYYALAFIMKL